MTNDIINILEISNVVNKRYVHANVNTKQCEKSMITGYEEVEESNPVQEFRHTIKELTDPDLDEELEIETDDFSIVSESKIVSQPIKTEFGYVEDALKSYAGMADDVDIEKEHEEDIKIALLEDIHELIMELESKNKNALKNISEVNMESQISLLKKVHKILCNKYDHHQYLRLGKKVVMTDAQALEYFCDGKTKIRPFKPDLVGWHNTAQTKINKMRYETASVVTDIINEYNILPGGRILIELLSSMFLHNKMHKDTYFKDEVSNALDDLHEFDH